MLVGAYEALSEISDRLVSALPPVLSLSRAEWECPLIPLLCEEIAKDDPGQEAVLDRLLDLLLVAALRAWFDRPDGAAPAWYRAQSDPIVGRTLRLMQANPAHPWTLAGLARRGRGLAGGACPAVSRSGRRAAHELPHGVAHRARRRPSA